MSESKYNKALIFVVLLGLISLFSDMTYESARSINGQFLQLLGTNGFTVGFVAGLGELLGYGLRFFSGYLADKTKKYWTIVIIGYLLNLISVPLLAFAGYWQLAIFLIIAERVGKALRSPARDALLSFGTQKLGRGWGYGLHEAMDQIGATIGPILVSAIMFYNQQNYKLAYAMLAIPAFIAITILFTAKFLYPHPENLEIKKSTISTANFSKPFWLYIAATTLVAAGFIDFPLIAYHWKANQIVNEAFIPTMYAFAMAVDAMAALIFGRLFDKYGLKIIVLAILMASFFAPLVLFGNFTIALVGMLLWGVGMGAQESIFKAYIANLIPSEQRGTAFGTYNAAYGLLWFIGSSIMGLLYDYSLIALVSFSVVAQLFAFTLLLSQKKLFTQS